MRLSGPSRTQILIWFDDRKKATWVKVETVEPIQEAQPEVIDQSLTSD